DLRMDCFGIAVELDRHLACDPRTGQLRAERELSRTSELAQSAVGSWLPAQAVTCPRDAPKGMACIPGGAFALGGPTRLPQPEETIASPERLAQVKPFFLDVEELTVGRFDELQKAHGLPLPTQHAASPKSVKYAC